MSFLRLLTLTSILAALAVAALASDDKRDKREEANTRIVQGIVRDTADNPAGTAIVKLKNTSNLQVRSYITRDDGRYIFQGLSTTINYELTAERGTMSSPVRTLSVFDSRRKAIINLKLEPKK